MPLGGPTYSDRSASDRNVLRTLSTFHRAMTSRRDQLRLQQPGLAVALDRACRQSQGTGELGGGHELSLCHADHRKGWSNGVSQRGR